MAKQPWAAWCVWVRGHRSLSRCPGGGWRVHEALWRLHPRPGYLCSCHPRSLGALRGNVSCFRIIHTLWFTLEVWVLDTVGIMGTCLWPEAFGSAGSVLWVSVCFFCQLLTILEESLLSVDLLFRAFMTSGESQLKDAVWRKPPPSLPQAPEVLGDLVQS